MVEEESKMFFDLQRARYTLKDLEELEREVRQWERELRRAQVSLRGAIEKAQKTGTSSQDESQDELGG